MTLWVFIGLAGTAALLYLLFRFGRVWYRARGARVVTCPETGAPAGVAIDAARAAATSFLGIELRLKECARWPERAGCGQECLRQIESAPDGCLVRNLLAAWYEGKSCAGCGTPFGPVRGMVQMPAVRLPGGALSEWREVKPEDVPATLTEGQPVCFGCYIATRFAREHPGMIVDRAR